MGALTNYTAGPRGVNVKGGSTRWIEPGESIDVAKADIVGDLPDLGKKPADESDGDTLAAALSEVEALKQTIADRDTEIAALKKSAKA